jgi:hypothetical protein
MFLIPNIGTCKFINIPKLIDKIDLNEGVNRFPYSA